MKSDRQGQGLVWTEQEAGQVEPKKAWLRSFDSGTYRATIQMAGSQAVYLEEVAVARNIPAAEMAVGRKVAVVFFDRHNARDAVILAVYT